MILIKHKRIRNIMILLNMLMLIELYRPHQSISSVSPAIPNSDYIRKSSENDFYILGPGDGLIITVSDNFREFDSRVLVDGEGMITLKRLNKIYVSGLTIGELTEILNKEYLVYLKEPNVVVSIREFRPIEVYIDGEVENPGMYTLWPNQSVSVNPIPTFYGANRGIEKPSSSLGLPNLGESSYDGYLRNNRFQNKIKLPTLIDIIRRSGGVTLNANIKDIRVTRVNSISNGGGRLVTNVNLLNTLNLKDSSQNIRLYDNDMVFISRTEVPILSEISKAIKSNLNPKFISVYVGGRVQVSGPIKINKTSSLNDAIDMSGGSKVLKGPVRFIRYNSNGTIDKRKFKYKRSASRGSFRNPFLKDGDLIFIEKSGLNIASEVLEEVTSPLRDILSSYIFYELFVEERL